MENIFWPRPNAQIQPWGWLGSKFLSYEKASSGYDKARQDGFWWSKEEFIQWLMQEWYEAPRYKKYQADKARFEKKEETKEQIIKKENDEWYSVLKKAKDFVWWAVAQVPEVVANVIDSVDHISNDFNMWQEVFAKTLEKKAEKEGVDFDKEDYLENQKNMNSNEILSGWLHDAKDYVRSELWIEDDSVAWKVWGFLTEFASIFVWPWWAKVAWKLAEPLQKIATKFPWLEKVIANWLAKKVWTGVVEWALDTAKFNIASEGELDWDEMLIGGALWWSIPVLFKWIKEVAKPIANKLQLSWLLNPKKLEYVSNSLRETGDDVDNVANWMFERNIKGSKKQIVSKLADESKKTRGMVDDIVDSADWLFKPDSAKNAIDEMIEALWTPKSSGQIYKLEELKNLTVKFDVEWLNLKEIQKVKRNMDEMMDLYTVAGDVKAWQKKIDLAGLRSDIRKFLEDTASDQWLWDLAKLNKDTAVAKQLEKFINYKDKTDSVRDLLSPFASPFAWWVLWWMSGWESIEDRLQNIVMWAVAWKIVWSTKLKTNLANIIWKMTLEKQRQAYNGIVSWQLNESSSRLVAVIADAFDDDDSETTE